MPNLDTLTITFSSKGTERAVENIRQMGYAIRNLAQTLKAVDGSKIDAFAQSLDTLKKSTPTNSQTERMVAFGAAVKDLSEVIGTANIGGFSKDMATLGDAVQAFKKSSVNSITNAVTAMQTLGQTAQQTASAVSNAVPKNSQNVSMGDNKGTLETTRQIIDSLDKVQVKATGVSRILEKMGLATPTKKFKELEANAEKVRQKYEELRVAVQKSLNEGEMTTGSDTYKKKMAELDALRNSYNELILKQRELAQEGGAVSINPTLMSSINAFKSGVSQTASILKNGLLAGIRFVNRHISSFVSHIKQAGSSLKNMVTGGNSATKMAKKFANEIFRVSKMLKLMVTRMALRKVIAEVGNGFKSLAIHSDEFNNSVSNIMNGAKQLGYSFASLVSPLINALAPAIVYVINLLTKLLNAINQVMSALLGFGTWNKAKNFTDSWRDSLEDAGASAKKTAKELKKTVLGFDELNQLQDNKDTSSSGGKGGIADMFDTLPIDQKWKDIADWLKKMWEIGDFYELGKMLGEKLRDWLESIPWDSIRKTANKLGKSLATLINGFVEVERLGYDIGKTIAQSVNTVFEFLNGFVHNLHWDSIGKFIADTFNGFFETIDWPLIKDTVVTGMAGIAEAIQNFIDTFHWDNISNFVINGIDTVTSGIKSFVEGIKWEDLGVKIGDQLNKIARGVDWKSVGETIGEVIEAAVDWAYGFITTWDVDDAVKALEDFFKGVFEKVDAQKVGETIGTALHKILEVIRKFWANEDNRKMIKDEIVGFFRGLFGSMTESDFDFIAGSAAALAILNGLKAIFTKNKLGVTIAITVTTAYLGVKFGSWLGKILTGDKAYDQYTIPVMIEWVIGELPSSWNDFKDKLKDWVQGWEDMRTQADAFIQTLTRIVEFLGNPIFATLNTLFDIGGGNNSVSGNGGAGANIDTDEWQKTIDAAREAGEANRELGESLSELNGKFSETKGWADNFSSGLNNLTSEIDKSSSSYNAASASIREMGEESKRAYESASSSATGFYDATKGIATETSKASDSIKQAKGTTDNLNQELKNASSKMSDLKGDSEKMSTAVNESSSTMEKLRDRLKETKDSSKNYTDMKTTVERDSGAINTAVNNIKLDPASQEINRFSSQAITDYLNAKTEISNNTEEISNEVNALDFSEASDTFSLFAKDTDKSMDDAVKSVDDGAKDITEDIKKIQDGFRKDKWTFNGVADGLGETFRKAKNAIKREWNEIANTLNGNHEVGTQRIKIDLPKFARGGFPEDGLFMANHHELVGQFSNGKTAVANNAQIVEGISSGVYSAVSRAMAQNGGSDKYISNTIVVDGEVIARTVTKAQERQNMRYSPSY